MMVRRPLAALGLIAAAACAPGSDAKGTAQALRFEPNAGQSDPRAAFVVRGRHDAGWVTSEGLVVDVRDAAGGRVGVRFRPLDAEPAPCAEGLGELDARVSRFVGADPSRWASDLRTYARVAQREVWPGIDIVHHGAGGRLEYDVVVSPGADPRTVRLAIDGALALQLDAEGNLLIDTAAGRLVQRAPLAYQEIEGSQREVGARCLVLGPAEIGFEVADYDRARELVIDPLVYSTFLGGTENPYMADPYVTDAAKAVSVDAAGNAYVAGWTQAPDFPTTPGAYDRFLNHRKEMFVTKLSPTGAMLWSTYLGTMNSVDADLAIDGAGSVAVCTAADRHAPTTAGAYDRTFNGSQQDPSETDAWIGRLDPTGSRLLLGTYLGGRAKDKCTDIELDGAGNIVVVGETVSPDFPTTYGAVDQSLGGGRDIFLSRLNPAGSSLTYSTYLGGSGDDGHVWGHDLALDASGAAYITGRTTSPDYPTTPGAFDASLDGSEDAFLTKVAWGSEPVFSTYLGGTSFDWGVGVAVDASGSAYVAGDTESGDFPTTRGAYDTHANNAAAFVTKFTPSGSGLVYSTVIEGSRGSVRAHGFALSAAGEAFVTGQALPGYPTTAGAFDPVGHAIDDAFLTKLDATGSSLLYSTFLGGSWLDMGCAIAVETPTRACVVGLTRSADFPVRNAFDSTLGGPDMNESQDGFVLKLDL